MGRLQTWILDLRGSRLLYFYLNKIGVKQKIQKFVVIYQICVTIIDRSGIISGFLLMSDVSRIGEDGYTQQNKAYLRFSMRKGWQTQ